MRNKIAVVIYRIVVFITLFFLFLLAYLGIQHRIKKNGNVKLDANNVEAIHNISASGIAAYLYDHYYFRANEITFSDEIELGNPLGYIQYQDNNGSWVNADILRVLPIQRDGRLLIKSLPERVYYTIGMACLNSPEDKLSFPCSIQYTFLSESKFKYILTAPYMEIYLYFQDDKHPNESDEFSVEFELQNCTILYQEQEITGPLRLFAHNKSDSGFQGDIWSNMGLFIASLNGNSYITDTFSGSASVEDMPYPDRFFCTYANEIDVDLEGSLSFRYGSHSSDYELFLDRVYLHADDSYLEENKKNQLEVLSEYINLDENGAWFSVDPFAANLEIEASNLDKTRTTSFKI